MKHLKKTLALVLLVLISTVFFMPISQANTEEKKTKLNDTEFFVYTLAKNYPNVRKKITSMDYTKEEVYNLLMEDIHVVLYKDRIVDVEMEDPVQNYAFCMAILFETGVKYSYINGLREDEEKQLKLEEKIIGDASLILNQSYLDEFRNVMHCVYCYGISDGKFFDFVEDIYGPWYPLSQSIIQKDEIPNFLNNITDFVYNENKDITSSLAKRRAFVDGIYDSIFENPKMKNNYMKKGAELKAIYLKGYNRGELTHRLSQYGKRDSDGLLIYK